MNRLKRFIAYYKPHSKLFALDLGCATAMCAVDLAFPLVTQYIVKDLLPKVPESPALIGLFFKLIVVAFLMYALRSVLQFTVSYWGHLLGVKMETDIRSDMFSHVESLGFGFFDKIRTGKLLSRMTSDLFEITELAHHGPEDLLISSVTIVGAFIIMFNIEWRLALPLAILMPLLIAFTMRMRVSMRKSSLGVKEKMAEINANIESSISGARVAKAFTNEDHEKKKFQSGNRQYIESKKSYYRSMAVFHTSVDAFTGFCNVAVLAAGGLLIWKRGLDPVVLLTFTLYIGAFTNPVKKLSNFAEQYMLGMAGFERFCEVMDTAPEIQDAPDAVPIGDIRGDIAFENVSFAYGEGKNVLNGIDLTIPAGKTVALVGPSGGGKTTLCQLIPRFYEVTAGRVTVDGKDIRTVTMQSLREKIGIVQQDVFLFADTVMENIRYGRIGATDEEVIAAAKHAQIHEEIEKMPDGYQTKVGERGITLSGGQKQRIAIARLFLKDPPILILDEATSALDTVTETEIQKSFDALSVGRTALVIAHRLSTVRHADEIVVIDEDGIRERGTHEELVALGGRYATLYRATLRD
ncbi:MAG: ABC transporter ATP-binding protein [Clostridia bacterium]|nr:ABC transporter ATP-binding protein [Clostridia bacterium]